MATPSAGRSGESGEEESEQNSGSAGPGPLKGPAERAQGWATGLGLTGKDKGLSSTGPAPL